MTSLSVVLPAYNEAENIEEMTKAVMKTITSLTEEYEIIVVDDGSRDGTGDVVQGLNAEHPRIRLVQHDVNRGYGAALYSGFKAATKDLIFFTDADRQFELADLHKFWPEADSVDMVIGYRPERADPFHRRLFGWGWTWFTNLLFGYTARDVDCAFKLFKREIIDSIEIKSMGATFSAEFLVRAKAKGYTIRELPVRHLPRVAGSQTGSRLDVILRAFWEILIFRIEMWRKK
ncbi:MAG: glycosyltransferase family 2 protein [Chloroflexota bacterium]|nr:glycosyltransferase family 2 protein [Anaerolineae bacterium]